MLLRQAAFAKVNLFLAIKSRQPDGYHRLEMLNQTVSLADTLTLSDGSGTGKATLSCDRKDLPTDESNLVLAAARAFFAASGLPAPIKGLHFDLKKRIPSQAGLGGGSADAAAALRLLNRRFDFPLSEPALFSLAEQLGADVPFALLGGTALVFGKGEQLSPLPPLTDGAFLLVKPAAGISTKAAFAAYDAAPVSANGDFPGIQKALAAGNLPLLGQKLFNHFEALAPLPEIAAIKAALIQQGALGAALSGSGSTVFGLFETVSAAETAKKELSALAPFCAVCTPCDGKSPA